MRWTRFFPWSDDPQKGGVTILMALVLLVIMSAAAFSLSQNSIRELSIVGTVTHGAKAAAAADSGIDWYVIWAQTKNAPIQAVNALPTSTAGSDRLADHLRTATQLRVDDHMPGPPIRSIEASMASDDMVFDNTAAFIRQNASAGNRIVQKFDILEIRKLGSGRSPESSNSDSPSAGKDLAQAGSAERYFRVLVSGQASADVGGGSFHRFNAVREAIVVGPPYQW